jgi:formylglycine-generating enzyme required for sulfatase activity
MASTEITQKQWQSVMKHNPSWRKGDRLPVESVSWAESVEFCRKLSAADGRIYRLPTEKEWNFTCDDGMPDKGTNQWRKEAWTLDNTTRIMPVGSLAPNGWGLYDMHGNVAEWCSDEYSIKGRIPSPGGGYRVVKGGSYGYFVNDCASSDKMIFLGGPHEDYRSSFIGLRIVCEVSSNKP